MSVLFLRLAAKIKISVAVVAKKKREVPKNKVVENASFFLYNNSYFKVMSLFLPVGIGDVTNLS